MALPRPIPINRPRKKPPDVGTTGAPETASAGAGTGPGAPAGAGTEPRAPVGAGIGPTTAPGDVTGVATAAEAGISGVLSSFRILAFFTVLSVPLALADLSRWSVLSLTLFLGSVVGRTFSGISFYP